MECQRETSTRTNRHNLGCPKRRNKWRDSSRRNVLASETLWSAKGRIRIGETIRWIRSRNIGNDG